MGLSVLSLRDMCGTLFSAHSPTAKRGGKRTRFVGERKRPENRVRRFPVEEGGAVRHQRGPPIGGLFWRGIIFDACHPAELAANAATPYPATPDFPLCRGQNKPLYTLLWPHAAHCPAPIVPPRSGVPSGGTTTRRILQLTNSPSFSAGPLFYRGRRSTVLRRRDW